MVSLSAEGVTMPDDFSARLPQTNGAASVSETCPPIEPESKACPPPPRETVDWFTEAIRPALKQVADSFDLMNFALLREAAQKLPAAEQPAWRELVRQMEIMVGKELGSGHPGQFRLYRIFKAIWAALRRDAQGRLEADPQTTFGKLLRELNTNWFLPRSLLLYHYSEYQLPSYPPPRLWETMSVALAGTPRVLSYPFADGVIPVYIVRHLAPLPAPTNPHHCYYDPLSRAVLIDAGYTDREMYRVKVGARADDLLAEYFFLDNSWDRKAADVEKQYCQWLDRRYPKVQDLCFRYSRRVLAEELRHGMDAMRAKHNVPEGEYAKRLEKTILAPKGRVRHLFWEPVQSGKGDALLRGQAVVQAERVISELSAQMTAAAIPDPGIVLAEWWRKVASLAVVSSDPWHQRFEIRQYPNHTLAGILGTILLGEQLNCGPPLSWSMLCEPDFAALADLAANLANRPETELRLALKAIYRNEFNYPIDEPPFAEILANGKLRNRVGSQRAGLCHDGSGS